MNDLGLTDIAAPVVETDTAPVDGTEPVTTAPVDAPKADRASSRIAKLAAENRAHQTAIKDAEAKLAAATTEAQEYRALVELAKLDPLGAARKLGLDYVKLSDQILEEPAPEPETPLHKEVAELKAKQLAKETEEKAAQQAAAEKAHREAASQLTAMVKTLIEADPTLDLIPNFEDAPETAMQAAHIAWTNDGKNAAISDEDFAEQYLKPALKALQGHYEAEAQKYQKKTTKTETFNLDDLDLPGLSETTPPKTITNSMGGSAPPRPAPKTRDPQAYLQELLEQNGLS